MTGDANAAAYRLYNAGRKDQQGGARKDANNSTIAVGGKFFEQAFNKNRPISKRTRVITVFQMSSYEHATESLKQYLNEVCVRQLDYSNDTITTVIFDSPRNPKQLRQREAQEKTLVEWHRQHENYTGNADGSGLPSGVLPAPSVSIHVMEAQQHVDIRDFFQKDVDMSNSAWCTCVCTMRACSCADLHVPRLDASVADAL